jgi:hypothetical protein
MGMKKLFFIGVLLASGSVLAASATKNLKFTPVDWHLSTQSETININNSTERPWSVLIITQRTDSQGKALGGLRLANCGSTYFVSAGSTVICPTTSSRPLSFGMGDSRPAKGTYQIEFQ